MSSNDNSDPNCLTVGQLARRWRCSRKVIHEAIGRKSLAVFRVGKKNFRILISEVERYERENLKKPEAA